MDPKPASSPFSEYTNAQLEAMLHKPELSAVEKERVRSELTRRLRDDLLKTAQNVTDSKRRQERQGQVLKTSRLLLLIIVAVLCISSILCLYVLAPDDWLPRLTELLQPLFTLLSG